MARYSLWAKNKIDSSKNFIIKLNSKDLKLSEKVDLNVIDFYTTEFENDRAILSTIENIDNIDNWSLEITYQSNKKTKTLDVAYFDDVLIKNYSHNYSNQKFIPMNDQDLLTIRNELLQKSDRNSIFYRDVLDSTYMNDYIKTKITNFVYARSSSYDDQNTRDFSRRQLTEELARYKNIRGVMFFIKKIKNKYHFDQFPVFIDKTNIAMKTEILQSTKISDEIVDTNTKDPDKWLKYDPPFETEFVFNDPFARNYDEPEIIDIIEPYDDNDSKKSSKKVYTKKLPNQSFVEEEF